MPVRGANVEMRHLLWQRFHGQVVVRRGKLGTNSTQTRPVIDQLRDRPDLVRNWPKLARARPDLDRFRPHSTIKWPRVGQIWPLGPMVADSARNLPVSTETGPETTKSDTNLTKNERQQVGLEWRTQLGPAETNLDFAWCSYALSCSISAPSCLSIRLPGWPKFARIWAKYRRYRAKLGLFRTKVGRCWSTSSTCWSNSDQIGSTALADSGPNRFRANVGQLPATVFEVGITWVNIGSDLADSEPKVTVSGPTLVDVGQFLGQVCVVTSESGRLRHEFSQARPGAGHVPANLTGVGPIRALFGLPSKDVRSRKVVVEGSV